VTTQYISVNRHIVASNKKNQETNPPFEIRTAKNQIDPQRVSDIAFANPVAVRLVYDPKAPLFSGAVCWIEVDTN
jgi:hypothetical protein